MEFRSALPHVVSLALLCAGCANNAPVFECLDCQCEIGVWELQSAGDGPGTLAMAPLIATPEGFFEFGRFAVGGDPKPMPVWRWDGTGWSDLQDDAEPITGALNKSVFAAAYHEEAGHIVIVGGVGAGADLVATWTYSDSGEWARAAADMPDARLFSSAAYDPTEDAVVVVGGGPSAPVIDPVNWFWNGSEWSETTDGPSPPRQGTAMAYDESQGGLVLFGGRVEVTFDPLSDTWLYRGGEWTEVTTANSPNARAFHTLTHYPTREVTLLFGGSEELISGIDAGAFDDIWAFDGTNWREVFVPGDQPGGFTNSLMTAWDAANEAVLVRRLPAEGLGEPSPELWLFRLSDADAATGSCCGDGECQFPERDPRSPDQACPADCP